MSVETTKRDNATRDRVRASGGCAVTRVTMTVLCVVAVLGAAGCGGSSKPKPISVKPITPVGLSLAGLKTLAQAVPTPIYWAGPQARVNYELRRTTNGNVYVRYLTGGAKVGNPSAQYLVVATYPFNDAYAALQKVAGSAAVVIPGGGIAFPDAKDPHSVHVAYPNSNYQVEVYSPSATQALTVARSGRVQPVS